MPAFKSRFNAASGALLILALVAPAQAGFLAGYGGNTQISATSGGIIDFAVVGGGLSDLTFASIYSHFSTAVSTPGGSATPGNYLYLYEVTNNTANTLQVANVFANTSGAENWGTFNGLALNTMPTSGAYTLYPQSVTSQSGLVVPSSVDNSYPFAAYFQFTGHKLTPGAESVIFGFTSNFAPMLGASSLSGFTSFTALQGSGTVPLSTPEPSGLVLAMVAGAAALACARRAGFLSAAK